MSELTIEDLYNRTTSEEQVKEATAFNVTVVPPGRYGIVEVKRIEPRITPAEWRTPNREYIDGFIKVASDAGTTFLGFQASWQSVSVQTQNGERLDVMSKLWGQLVKFTETAGKSVGETINTFKNYPQMLSAYVIVRGRKGEESPWTYFRKASQYDAAKAEGGYEFENLIDSFNKATV